MTAEVYDHLRRLSQTKRLLRLTFPHDDAPQTSQLVINRLDAQKGLGPDGVSIQLLGPQS